MSAPESPSPIAPGSDLDAAFWQAVGEAWPDGLLVLDGKGRILALNHAATTLLGGGQTEFLQQILAYGQAEAPFIPLPDNFPIAHGDGTIQVIQTHWATVPGLKGGTLRIGLLRSQSDGAVCDAMLVRSEEQLASITANLPGVVFQRVMTPDGTIRYPFFTEGIRRVVGFAPEEIRVTSDGCLDLVHWADRADHLAAIRRSGQDLAPCIEEFRAITKDGEVRWLQGSSRPRMLTNGSLQWDGVLIDVSDRKRAEQTLQMIMDHAADTIITLNVEGRMESVNAAVESLFGYSVAELIGQSVCMLMPEPYRSQHDEFVSRYLESGEGQILGKGPRELVGQRKDGTTFPFEIATSEVRLEGRRLFIGIGRDITVRKKTEAALRETEQRLANVAANLPGIVFQRLLHPDGQLEYPYVSEAIRDLLGIDPADAVANPRLLLDTIAPEMLESFMLNLRRSARTLEPFEEDLLVFAASGEETWMRTRSRPRLLADGAVIWEGVMLDVTDRKRAEDQLSFLAYHDPLTKAVTRDRLLERFAEAAPEAQAGNEILALASIGIDRFSFINTTLGHSQGDQLLVKLAERLTSCLSEGDILARVGGDRFMLMLTGMSDAAEIMITIEQILTRLCDPFHLNDEEIELTASIGVSLYPEDGDTGESLVKNADAALLRSKSTGPGTIQRFVPEMNAGVARTLSLQHRLRRALEQEEFVPFFQPQVELSEGRIVGMEALVRWMSPGGMISPAEFIPVAEESGLIDGICEQMLRACCRQIRHWQAEGLAVVPVAVNISGRQFHQPKRLVHALETVLAETGLEPRFLELELTESSAMSDPESAISVVSMLRDRGLVCSIDDFGTGYSSLSVLKSFPINKLKIDRSFVMDIASDPNDAAIVTAIIAMAHALKLKVVAEGVETQDHLEFLRNLGCDQIQGYLFSRPLPASDMRTMLADDRRLALPSKK